MPIFATGANGSAQTNDGSKLDFLHEQGTAEIRAYVNSNIVSNSPEMDRIIRYQLYWNFYNGKHWRMYNDSFLSFNYVKAFINKVTSFCLGKNGFSINVEREDGEPVDTKVEKAVESLLEFIWRKNKKVTRQHEILQMGSVSGDAWVHLQYVNDVTFKKRKYLQIQCLDSRHCFPEFLDGNLDNLSAFVIRQPLGKNPNNFKVFCTRYTDETVETWYQKDTNSDMKSVMKYNENSFKNIYGFIPIVHLKNTPKSDNYFGDSDCCDILKLNKTYNELSQTVKTIIDYYVEPTTVVTGGTIKSITKGIGRIWSGLPAEANVFNLGLGEDLNGAMTFMQLIKTNMHEIGDMPENALGRLQAISNTSAAALEITYQPLVQQADKKAATYGDGFTLLHHLIIEMVRIAEPENKYISDIPEDFYDTHSAKPVFNYGLPDDVAGQLQNADTEMRLGIDSKVGIMNRMGKKNIPKILKEIADEKLRDAEIEGKAMLLSAPIGEEQFKGGKRRVE